MGVKRIVKKLIPNSILEKRSNKPRTFSQKISWLKQYDRNPVYSQYADKYEAKRIVADWIGKQYIIPTLGIYDNYKQIDFSKLPEQFVLKCTHDSGSVKICKEKNSINHDCWEKWFNDHLKINYFDKWGEWAYKNVKPRIIAEKYMNELDKQELIDYKFFCFNGKPEFIYVSIGLQDHTTAKISFYDMQGNEMPFYRKDYNRYRDVIFPNNFPEMKRIAEIIANNVGSPFVRVDLYSVEDKTYFSEITFYPNGGYIPFEPPKWDKKLGKLISLQSDKQKG